MIDQSYDPATKPYTNDDRMVDTATRHAAQAQALPQAAPSKLTPRSYGKAIGKIANGAERVSNISQLGAIATAAAGVGAVSGYGLVLGLSTKQVVDIVSDVRASIKSANHASQLKRIQHQAKLPPKWCGSREQHAVVAYQVLPYIINQKKEKGGRRLVHAMPGLGFGESLYAAWRKGYKTLKGTLGTQREKMATELATHLIADNCELAESIVSELFDESSMLWLKHRCTIQPAAAILAQRMKSR
tara:strand:- start:1855 stop:2586 length:732 start_codon:yes stop_codon:yes gene_type:complete